ncbi:carboxylesterase [Melghirimyces profundicolus]|uniref:Carboxylesterase n=1 Tax=Melghirimyces profundicolus TaxID=1242148 RepID=A0A2T6B0R3_9BACL|nr:alpha/beta fold hydrolase [Melghirimyces profundicolus]PTX49613.1 carboxylesterase [Melghirimyces profundicolus]
MTQTYTVMKEAEPFYFPGNDIGILIQHGFTGTTQSMRGLGEHLAKCGFTVHGPRLKGHGTHYEEMENTTYEDWIESSDEGYRKLKETCSEVFVVGLSMGGTLALHLARQYPETKGIVLINAAMKMDQLEQVAQMEEPRFLDAIGSDIKAEGVQELAYEKTPLKSVREIVKFMEVTREKVPAIHCPALILVSKEDHVVPPDNSRFIYENLKSGDKTLAELENSYHVATLDNDKERICRETEAFIKRLAES